MADFRSFRTLDDIAADFGDLHGRRVLVRVDFNVPMDDGAVSDATRIMAALPTINELADRGAIVLLLSHFGRPQGQKNPSQSLSLIVGAVGQILGRDVMFIPDCVGEGALAGIAVLAAGDVAVLENTRFHSGEEANDPGFAAGLAAVGDLYVNDAFSAAHRAHGSTAGVAALLPSFAGRAMARELAALDAALGAPVRPVAALVGGAKVSSKIEVLRHLVGRVQHLVIGGGMANTFLAARGAKVGKSLCEHDLLDVAEAIFAAAEAAGCTIHLPYDVVVAREFAAHPASLRTCSVFDVADDEMILDIGPAAVEAIADVLKNCRTVVWNGPMGAFETPPFDAATVAVARTVAALTGDGTLVSVAGGGDTVAAVNHAGIGDALSFVSTAGGAFLEWMEGRALPGVDALRRA